MERCTRPLLARDTSALASLLVNRQVNRQVICIKELIETYEDLTYLELRSH